MKARESQPRRVDGIVLLDKPAGVTSNWALQRVKRIYRAAKAGHTGSLDPMATGMLPICLGHATKVSGWLLDSAKEYRVVARFGVATDTGDSDGMVVDESDAPQSDTRRVREVLESMLGESLQVPPMYSALKHRGRRMYALARQGIEVERAPRTIRVERIELESHDWPEIAFAVRCSKGTYIRSLVVDIAAKLETVAHVTSLRRTRVDPFRADEIVSLAELEGDLQGDRETATARLDRHLIGADRALMHLDEVSVDQAGRRALAQGRVVGAAGQALPHGIVRIYDEHRTFVGLGELGSDGSLQPRKIFCADMVE